VHQLLLWPGGGQQIATDRAGLAALTGSLIDEGTAERAALEIAAEVESLGGYLSSQADWDSLSASLGVLAEHSAKGLELLAEIAIQATFPDAEVERLRSQHLAELQRRRAQPANVAADELARILYADTIYSLPLLGTADSVHAIRRQEILEIAQTQIVPDGATLVMVGDFDPEPTEKLIDGIFGDWKGPARAVQKTLEPRPLSRHRIRLVDRPEAPQTELWMGQIGVPRSHPDRAGLVVLNSLLGGKFTSRLNLNLRERLGITYGISTSFTQRRGPGPFIVAASVDTDAVGTAVEEVLSEIRRLQDEWVAQEELEDTQSYLLGIFPYTLQRIEGLASRLADLAVYDLPSDYFANHLEQIANVTREDLQELARRHFRPEQMGIVAVGPGQQLRAQLEPFGSLEIDRAPSS
jgi:predicted Zn-dependent peptidase